MQVVKKLNEQEGMTVINITHYMDEIIHADKVFVMDSGRLAFSGTPEEVFARRDDLERLGLAIPLSDKISHELQKTGVLAQKTVLDKKTLGDELCKLFPKV